MTASIGGFFSFESSLRQDWTPENWACGFGLLMFWRSGVRERSGGREREKMKKEVYDHSKKFS